jgi:hypothetical protein
MHSKWILPATIAFCSALNVRSAESPAAAHFRQKIQPILNQYCYDCHADGANKGGVAFDEFKSDNAIVTNIDLWLAVLKNVRSGLMPPQKKARPAPEEQKRLENWIKYEVFRIDPNHPDPGRVTLRRLNRIEYRNTIRDLVGIDFDTQEAFPPDDTGYGFDNIGDVLTLSPMMLEKYLDAANLIIAKAVPLTSRAMAEKTIPGRAFRPRAGNSAENYGDALNLSYYQATSVTNSFWADHPGHYELALDISANESYVEGEFDYNRCRLIFKADGQEILRQDFARESSKPFHFEFKQVWDAGMHELSLEVEPLTPDQKHVRSLSLRINNVLVRGPSEEPYWIQPANYKRFFPKEVPGDLHDRRAYARELLSAFATRAFRRPVDDNTADRLTALAEKTCEEPGKTFEAGVAQAMTAVLVSPQFLFHEEAVEKNHPPGSQPFVDEYSLASRLSYFLWSTMPDAELLSLAGRGELRKNLPAQVKRMLADPRSDALVRNFSGQWLQTRDIETVPIDARAVLAREQSPDPETERLHKRFRELAGRPENTLTAGEKEEFKNVRTTFFKTFKPPRANLSGDLRFAMRQETELYFGGIVREDRNVAELIESDYDYLNEKLARHYGLTNLGVTGNNLYKVKLPPGCVRGGVLTMGSVLAVTSNPSRTSAVKRGLFILQNILGNPTPPPPPNIPPLEDAKKESAGHPPTSREALEIHRTQPLCSSCHARMDPLGLAFENFNALGLWRDKEFGEPIETSGALITGESFKNANELKHLLATNHRSDFYRTLTEKLLTYALGRGLEYYDVETVDQIVARLEDQNGRFSALLYGVIESAPFQKRREFVPIAANESADHGQQQAKIKNQP